MKDLNLMLTIVRREDADECITYFKKHTQPSVF